MARTGLAQSQDRQNSSMEKESRQAAQLLAEELLAVESQISLRMWPLGGQPHPSEWPRIQVYRGSPKWI